MKLLALLTLSVFASAALAGPTPGPRACRGPAGASPLCKTCEHCYYCGKKGRWGKRPENSGTCSACEKANRRR